MKILLFGLALWSFGASAQSLLPDNCAQARVDWPAVETDERWPNDEDLGRSFETISRDTLRFLLFKTGPVDGWLVARDHPQYHELLDKLRDKWVVGVVVCVRGGPWILGHEEYEQSVLFHSDSVRVSFPDEFRDLSHRPPGG